MLIENGIWMGKNDERIVLIPKLCNRHGLIAGATGTGKTITLKVMAEGFSDAGIPVFVSDVKGDLAGMCLPGEDNSNMQERITRFGIDNWSYHNYPTRFWDIYGEKGHPLRTTISDMGPTLISRLLNLSDVQQGVLNIVFHIADDEELLLLDLKDLKSMLNYVNDHRIEYSVKYGNISSTTISTISRELLTLEDQGADIFFNEPSLDIFDWMKTDANGKGYINILDSQKLIQSPKMYATFLLWMLSDLYEKMPEVGDCDKPKIVFFFDEAHLLFKDMPSVLEDKIEQVIKLIRSKGVGIFFCTQSPADLPDTVLAQLGNRVQHCLHAYTPKEQQAIRAAASGFRVNPDFDTKQALTELKTGEALVSFLQEDGSPMIVQRAFILPPQSKMGPIDDATRAQIINSSELAGKYNQTVDRPSAFESLENQRQLADQQAELDRQKAELEAERLALQKEQNKTTKATTTKTTSRTKKTFVEKTVDSMVSTASREVGRKLVRGLFDNLLK